MKQISDFNALRCYTAAGVLIQNETVLLVKHRKLGMWLPPGGHIEPNELAHVAAEREFFEETGIRVRAFAHKDVLSGTVSQYLPNPFATNLHWISKKRYLQRRKNRDAYGYVKEKTCEQHVVFIYLVKSEGSLVLRQNMVETDGIGWFTLKQLLKLETTEDIKREMAYAFALIGV